MRNPIADRKSLLTPDPDLQLRTARTLATKPSYEALVTICSTLQLDTFTETSTLGLNTACELLKATCEHAEDLKTNWHSLHEHARLDILDKIHDVIWVSLMWGIQHGGEIGDEGFYRLMEHHAELMYSVIPKSLGDPKPPLDKDKAYRKLWNHEAVREAWDLQVRQEQAVCM